MTGAALFGGTFDPVHVGHLIAAEAAADALPVKRVVFVPAGTPPHKATCVRAPADVRMRMIELAIRDNPRFQAWDFETRTEGPAYTIDTVRAWKAEHSDSEKLCFVIGADTIPELPTWRHIERLVEECEIVPVVRPGWEGEIPGEVESCLGTRRAAAMKERMIRVPLVDVSSSEVRRRIANGLSVRYLVPEAVRSYIEDQGLYQAGVEEGRGVRLCPETAGPP